MVRGRILMTIARRASSQSTSGGSKQKQAPSASHTTSGSAAPVKPKVTGLSSRVVDVPSSPVGVSFAIHHGVTV